MFIFAVNKRKKKHILFLLWKLCKQNVWSTPGLMYAIFLYILFDAINTYVDAAIAVVFRFFNVLFLFYFSPSMFNVLLPNIRTI